MTSGLVDLAKQLLAWKRAHLVSAGSFDLAELDRFFCNPFTLHANERHYDLSHQAYFDYLNEFRQHIVALSHQVHHYYVAENTVIMPMQASVEYDSGRVDNYEVVKFFQYNRDGKIILWKEVAYHIAGS